MPGSRSGLIVGNTTVRAREGNGEARKKPLVNPKAKQRYFFSVIKRKEKRKGSVSMNASPFPV